MKTETHEVLSTYTKRVINRDPGGPEHLQVGRERGRDMKQRLRKS